MTHAEAASKFGKCRNKSKGYLLAKHTHIRQRGRAFAVRYHNTDVVIIRPDGQYRLNSGGWKTVTTKNRMNMVLPRSVVHQSKGIWLIEDVVYYDNILLNSDGIVVERSTPPSKGQKA